MKVLSCLKSHIFSSAYITSGLVTHTSVPQIRPSTFGAV